MKETISEYTFVDALTPTNFSYEGARALFQYIEDMEESTGEQIEFDPIAIRCEFTEYKNLKEVNEDYSDLDIEIIEDLDQYTTVIHFKHGFIIQQF